MYSNLLAGFGEVLFSCLERKRRRRYSSENMVITSIRGNLSGMMLFVKNFILGENIRATPGFLLIRRWNQS
ncbi:hypothetical protein AN963_28625 [Brevibacillus choshinensis]|uniref:Uncharacterized protein n=1 Tax=Brevibacillus choshinensis TaxID=54911 RepID=A0ABR5MZ84_BRECH|nr:hypothetical protein AN963_28625 [Brevibacillus choshinensis]